MVACKLGMKSYLVLRGKKTKVKDGNVLLDKLAGARIKYITPKQYYGSGTKIMEALALELTKSEGAKPYIIPAGASYELGTFGYIKAT